MVEFKLKIGKRKAQKHYGSKCISAYTMPGNKFWKKVANRKARYSKIDFNGNSYKKLFQHMEWS